MNSNSEYTLHLGDCLSVMRGMDANSVDAIVCDPPYMINFMNKAFDRAKDNPAANVEVWAEMLRVAKPGAHLLAFGGDRTHHRMMCAIEDAGWELRTCLYWCFGSGFPKSHDVSKALDRMAGAEREVIGPNPYNARRPNPPISDRYQQAGWPSDITAPATDAAKQWLGWGSALKPSVEIIVMARAPLSEPTIAANVLAHGCGGLNIDGCRVETNGMERHTTPATGTLGQHGIYGSANEALNSKQVARAEQGLNPRYDPQGRWPANLLLDDQAAALLDEMSGERKSGVAVRHNKGVTPSTFLHHDDRQPKPDMGYGDVGGASRFFYVAKASKRDRDEGLEGMPAVIQQYVKNRRCRKCGRQQVSGSPCNCTDPDWEVIETERTARNFHPTVKSTPLMRWLTRLVTRPGGTVLDPFAGSGSTGKACMLEGFDFVGIELDEEYLAIARARIDHARRSIVQPMLELA